MTDRAEPALLLPEAVQPHAEGMAATFDLKVGDSISMRATARMSPAAILALGLTAGVLAIAGVALLLARR